MSRAFAAIALLIAPLLVVSSQAEPGFNCEKATTSTEKRLCLDDDGPITGGGYQWLDRQLARLYAIAKKQIPQAKRALLFESQRRFLKDRDDCDVNPSKCNLSEVYQNRLREVSRLVDVPDAFAIFKSESGELRIARFGRTASVSIWTVGGNEHACQLEVDNLPQGGNGVVGFRPDENKCRLDFVPEGDDVRVSSNGECQLYCGARASMDGLYRRREQE
jgi:uncharacterized protein